MLDEYRPAVLRGFDTAVADVGDQLHLCQPLLSFEGDPTLYVARRLDWQNDEKALAAADPSEASELGTLLPDTPRRTIASGEAVIAVGAGFVRAAKDAGVRFDGLEMDFAIVGNGDCRISVATPARFAKLKTRLADEARTAFDEDLGDAVRRGRGLSERGNAALLLLRRCGPRRRDDLAMRQLAGARQNRELDLYRRLLIRFALELSTPEDVLGERAARHAASAAAPLRYTTPHPSPAAEYVRFPKSPLGSHHGLSDSSDSMNYARVQRLDRDFEKSTYEWAYSDHEVSTRKSLLFIAQERAPDQRLPASNIFFLMDLPFEYRFQRRNEGKSTLGRDALGRDALGWQELRRGRPKHHRTPLQNSVRSDDALFKAIPGSWRNLDSGNTRRLKRPTGNEADLVLKALTAADARSVDTAQEIGRRHDPERRTVEQSKEGHSGHRCRRRGQGR